MPSEKRASVASGGTSNASVTAGVRTHFNVQYFKATRTSS
jgi:hypothetical protein